LSAAAPRDLLLLAALGLFWGLNWPAVRVILDGLPPFTLRATGFLAGALLLAALAAWRGERLVPDPAELPWLVAAGLLTVFGFNLATAYAQLATETSRAAIVAFTMPVWAVVMARLWLGEPVTTARLAALALGLAGLGLLLTQDLTALGRSPAGTLLALTAAVSWAAGTVVLKGRRWTIGPLAVATWLIAVSTPPMLVGAALLDRPWTLPPPAAAVWWALGYHIALPMVFCHAAWVVLVGRLPAGVAAIGTLLIPVVGVLSAALLLGERLDAAKLAALVLVLAAVTLAVGGPLRAGAAAASPRAPVRAAPDAGRR
jgi:drug/metabolite transporter (DMT)-like permease